MTTEDLKYLISEKPVNIANNEQLTPRIRKILEGIVENMETVTHKEIKPTLSDAIETDAAALAECAKCIEDNTIFDVILYKPISTYSPDMGKVVGVDKVNDTVYDTWVVGEEGYHDLSIRYNSDQYGVLAKIQKEGELSDIPDISTIDVYTISAMVIEGSPRVPCLVNGNYIELEISKYDDIVSATDSGIPATDVNEYFELTPEDVQNLVGIYTV